MINDIKDYHFISVLGEGGMATVYLAVNTKFDVKVAVKVLKSNYINDHQISERFLSEARKLFSLSHPNIVKVTDLINEDGILAFVMDYLEGQTLWQYLEQHGALTEPAIIDLFSQMLDAVDYLHGKNLVHRDIKPSNFMVDAEGRVKLLDFGIVKNLDTSSPEYTITKTTHQMGTPSYMSPEHVKSTKDVTFKTDIYSLGVVLWQMVTGKRPYDTNTMSTFDIWTRIVNEELAATGTRFDQVIARATAKNPEDRFDDCKAFKGSLREGPDAEKTIVENRRDKVLPTPTDTTIIDVKRASAVTRPDTSPKTIIQQADSTLVQQAIVAEDSGSKITYADFHQIFSSLKGDYKILLFDAINDKIKSKYHDLMHPEGLADDVLAVYIKHGKEELFIGTINMQWNLIHDDNKYPLLWDAAVHEYYGIITIDLPVELADAINDLFHKINGRKYNADNNSPSASDTENKEGRSALYKLVYGGTIILMVFVVWFLLPGYEETHQWWFHWIAKIVYTLTSFSAAEQAAKSVG
jgi:serine/threonine protein kinase